MLTIDEPRISSVTNIFHSILEFKFIFISYELYLNKSRIIAVAIEPNNHYTFVNIENRVTVFHDIILQYRYVKRRKIVLLF